MSTTAPREADFRGQVERVDVEAVGGQLGDAHVPRRRPLRSRFALRRWRRGARLDSGDAAGGSPDRAVPAGPSRAAPLPRRKDRSGLRRRAAAPTIRRATSSLGGALEVLPRRTRAATAALRPSFDEVEQQHAFVASGRLGHRNADFRPQPAERPGRSAARAARRRRARAGDWSCDHCGGTSSRFRLHPLPVASACAGSAIARCRLISAVDADVEDRLPQAFSRQVGRASEADSFRPERAPARCRFTRPTV